MLTHSLPAFVDELQKIADEDSNALVGAGSAGAGAYALSKAVPRVTGRTTYYHGTNTDSANTIRREGIRPAAQTGTKGVIDAGAHPEAWKNYGYVARSKGKAGVYAYQASELRGGSPEILKVSLPEWKKGLQTLENPETAGGFSAWRKRTVDSMGGKLDHIAKRYAEQGHPVYGRVSPEMARDLAKSDIDQVVRVIKHPVGGRVFYGVQNYGGERAIPHVPTEYIQGSKNYVPLSLKEVGQYIRARPGRFAAGVGLGAAGLAGLGYGASRFFGGSNQ